MSPENFGMLDIRSVDIFDVVVAIDGGRGPGAGDECGDEGFVGVGWEVVL